MTARTVAAVAAFVDAHRELMPVLQEHLEDNEGEILSHLLLADVVHWLVERRQSNPELCRSVFVWLEAEFSRGSDEVQALIAQSAVEMIPDPGEPGAQFRELLGPRLGSTTGGSIRLEASLSLTGVTHDATEGARG